LKKLTDEREILKIDGHNCKLLDEWTEDKDIYVLGQDIEDPTFYYARVNNKQEFEFDGANGAPSHDDVVSHYINYMSEQDINQYEAEYGADGRRAFPHLNDEPQEQITLHIKYQEPIVMNGWRAETDTITFDSRENMEAFISGNVAYDVLDNAIRKKDNEILLYAENANGDVIWRTKELEDEKNSSIKGKRFSEVEYGYKNEISKEKNIFDKLELPFPEYNEEEKFLLNSYKKYYETSAPIIEKNEKFYDIYSKLTEDGIVDLEIKYNPVAYDNLFECFNGTEYKPLILDNNVPFIYVNTLLDEYTPFYKFDDVKGYMSHEAIKKFEIVSDKIDNMRSIMTQLPIEFFSDEKLLNIMFNHFDNEPTVTLIDFHKQVNEYVLIEQKEAIRMDLKKNGLKPVDCLVKKILKLNKMTKVINTIDDIKTLSQRPDPDTKELLKDINKVLQYQMNQKLELQM